MPDLIAASEKEMRAIGAALAPHLRAGDVIALRGGLGTGKTTLVRGMLEALGLEGEAPSPSFAIVQPYEPPETTIPFTHVDLYRLEDAADTRELGLEEYLDAGVLAIEWPERLGGDLWPDALMLDLETTPQGTRRLTATVPRAWKDRWPFP
ncbi:MAG: tRNA (adenosine(37)-N6)-threonylcarbamoyltransferase complex ATPase subunit type 1 TsaE [Sphingobium sp.]